jgi:hypothetical protein
VGLIRFATVAGVMATVGIGPAPSRQTSGPLASRRVTGGPVVTLEIPTNDAAFSVFVP